MTEKHEIESMVSDIMDVIEDVEHEAKAMPGHGVEFRSYLYRSINCLKESIKWIDMAEGAMRG